MLQMNKAAYHSHMTTIEERQSIINNIIRNTMTSEGKVGSFLQENNGTWCELTMDKIQKLVGRLMEKCPMDPSLQLPSLQEAFARSLTLSENNAVYQKLRSDALSSMKHKKRKKKIRDHDPDYVNSLQSSVMLDKRQKK